MDCLCLTIKLLTTNECKINNFELKKTLVFPFISFQVGSGKENYFFTFFCRKKARVFFIADLFNYFVSWL